VLRLHVIPHEFTAFAVEKIHGFLHGIKNDPVPSQDPTGPPSDPFDLGAAEILEVVMIFGGQFVLSHGILRLRVYRLGKFRITIRL
jgi:hypothetical protein